MYCLRFGRHADKAMAAGIRLYVLPALVQLLWASTAQAHRRRRFAIVSTTYVFSSDRISGASTTTVASATIDTTTTVNLKRVAHSAVHAARRSSKEQARKIRFARIQAQRTAQACRAQSGQTWACSVDHH